MSHGFVVGLALTSALACGTVDTLDGPIDCSDITCAANASCDASSGTPLCTCDAGYEGDRQECLDVDECTDGTHTCGADEMCVNTDGSFTCARPQTCADIRELAPTARDGEYTLYIDGSAAQPWTALCVDIQGAAREYLPMATTTEGQNFAEYRASPDGRTGKSVRTDYTHVRIDPMTLRVDVSDATFGTSTGTTVLDGVVVEAIPFGVAMSCDRNVAGRANIDLTGVPFVLESGFCQGGIGVSGAPTGVPADSAVDLWALGACGWTRPDDACAANPLSGSAGQLQLSHTTYTKRVFVSSSAYSSDLGGIAGADGICQSLADGAGLVGEFKAWLGSSEGHPSERFIRHQVPYLLPDGSVVAGSWNDLTDGRLGRPIDLDENGQPVVGSATVVCTGVSTNAVWSGTSSAGESLVSDWTCQDWSGTGTGFGVGSFERVERGWSDACRAQASADGEDVCQGMLAHLYCFEQ